MGGNRCRERRFEIFVRRTAAPERLNNRPGRWGGWNARINYAPFSRHIVTYARGNGAWPPPPLTSCRYVTIVFDHFSKTASGHRNNNGGHRREIIYTTRATILAKRNVRGRARFRKIIRRRPFRKRAASRVRYRGGVGVANSHVDF